MNIDIKALGFTKEELQERVVERACEQLLSGVGYDPESDSEFTTASEFHRQMQSLIKERMEATINEIAEREVLPNVSSYVEGLVLQETNRWGEKVGGPVTFKEYLVQRADSYMQEKVDYQGRTKPESGGFSWSGTQTRITYLIHEHLHYSISHAMKDAMKVATNSIANGIAETAKQKLAEVSQSLKVEVKT